MSHVRILCHNVLWAQGMPFPTDQPGAPDPTIVAALAGQYLSLAPDVICLQEVQNEAAFLTWTAALDMEGAYCPGVAQHQYGTAVLWRTGRLVEDARSTGGTAQRAWQVAEVRLGDGGSVLVCTVHLPSGRQVGKERTSALRLEEMGVVLGRPTPPHVLAGDLNEQPGGPLSSYLSERGYLDAALATIPDGASPAPTALGGRRGDYLWVHETIRDRLSAYGVMGSEAVRTDVPGKTHLSDHLPLWIDLAVRS